MKCPPHTDQCEQDEAEDLKQVCRDREQCVEGEAETNAQQKGQRNNLRDLHGEEKLPFHPEESLVRDGLLDVTA